MAKTKSVYFCQNCGAESSKWIGRCPSCGEWNTYVEEVISKKIVTSYHSDEKQKAKPSRLKDINVEQTIRIKTNNEEFNRVLGGGIVPGSLILIGGEPGIGKSTLALQIVMQLNSIKSLYISGEESIQQIRLRAERLGDFSKSECLIHTETQLEAILNITKQEKPGLLLIDSIQTIHSELVESSPGSVSQVRHCAAELLKFSKQSDVPVLIIGHITKDGSIAGPKVLEHIVDTVLQFEGDQHHMYRILRSAKNRFGSTNEIGVYEMRSSGLKEIPNPSEILISQNLENLSGVAVSATIEGVRPFLVEVQALVSNSAYATPQRSTTGFDLRRLGMLLAVLEKRANFKLLTKDVFLNIAGGIRVDDPAIDLAVISAILSSTVDIPIPKNTCFAGEIGLSGEIRPVNRLEQRISEAEKMGFEEMILSTYSEKGVDFKKYKIKLNFVSKVQQLPKILFG
ncbi:MAG: DNA repair protein RadA [Bacteroidales bacterium]|nr:DNA repair protein RadA [Bacteroidales bacterium]MCF8389203.1 DNA repair protein RadA [Bacteroidales bacterium]